MLTKIDNLPNYVLGLRANGEVAWQTSMERSTICWCLKPRWKISQREPGGKIWLRVLNT